MPTDLAPAPASATPDGPDSGSHRHAPPAGAALALAFLVGIGLAVQAFYNGRLAVELGSVELAGVANMVTGGTLLVALAVGGGALRRAVSRVRLGAPVRWWMFVGGFAGALLVVVIAEAASEVGVALMTVAVVCGQSVGSLLVDRIGFSPAGPQQISAPRVAGVGLAIAGVAVGSLAARTEPRAALLAALVFAGVAFAAQQAVNARLATATGEPLIAGVVNFAVGGAVLTAVALIVVGGPPDHWDPTPWHWIGGLLGAAFVIVSAIAVPVIGVLRLTLTAVAGQAAGALALDLIAPVPGEAVTAGTVAGVLLALAAVAVSGRSPREGAGTAAG